MQTKTKAAIAIAICAAVVIAASYRLYFIREDKGGTVLWNKNEAYFFIPISRRGKHVSSLRYAWFLAKEYLGAIEPADDDRESLAVVRVTPSRVENHMLPQTDLRPGSGPSMYTPRKGRIYANCPALGGLCVWIGDHFEPAAQEEQRGFNGIEGLTEKDFDHGWSSSGFNSGFTINVGDQFTLSVNDSPMETENGAISIDLLRPGKPPERIWDLSVHKGRVSKTEYQHAFREHE
jgi:hypothetical protein